MATRAAATITQTALIAAPICLLFVDARVEAVVAAQITRETIAVTAKAATHAKVGPGTVVLTRLNSRGAFIALFRAGIGSIRIRSCATSQGANREDGSEKT
jgi:hypothetical protein